MQVFCKFESCLGPTRPQGPSRAHGALERLGLGPRKAQALQRPVCLNRFTRAHKRAGAQTAKGRDPRIPGIKGVNKQRRSLQSLQHALGRWPSSFSINVIVDRGSHLAPDIFEVSLYFCMCGPTVGRRCPSGLTDGGQLYGSHGVTLPSHVM